MYYTTRVLSLLVLQVGLVHCFPAWDIVVGLEKRLEFYYNRTLTHTEVIPSAKYIISVAYDPVHYRVLFAENMYSNISIFSFDLLTRKIQTLVTTKSDTYSLRIAYDPVSQLLFWMKSWSIYSFSLNSASSNTTAYENILVTLNNLSWDIAVDSCGRYIYWITEDKIERARFDGSEREVLIDSTVNDRLSLAIDQQTQRMYWIDRIYKNNKFHVSIESADFTGKNRRTLYENFSEYGARVSSLAVSNDYIYWRGINQKAIWQLPKNPPKNVKAKRFPHYALNYNYDWIYQIVATNYTVKEQIEGNPNCETLKSLIPKAPDSDSTHESLVCVHGTKVSGESRCECTQGYTGDRCEVSIRHNYCFQGNCSVSAEGKPICGCEAGYSGERCEVNTCHMYCLNNGDCSLNEEDEPVCECSADYEGERCEVAIKHTGQSCCCRNSKRDMRKEVRQAVKEELQHTYLRFVSNEIDEYEVNV